MPIAENAMMAGMSSRYGTCSSFTHKPIIGRLRMTSMALPIHIEATRPQNRSGRCVITCGPGWMPWMVSAPSISAITPEAGSPSVSMGMNLHCAAAVVGDSGACTPCDRPLAEGGGVVGTFFGDHGGAKRGDGGPGAGHPAEEAAGSGAAQDGADRLFKAPERGHRAAALGGKSPPLLALAE